MVTWWIAFVSGYGVLNFRGGVCLPSWIWSGSLLYAWFFLFSAGYTGERPREGERGERKAYARVSQRSYQLSLKASVLVLGNTLLGAGFHCWFYRLTLALRVNSRINPILAHFSLDSGSFNSHLASLWQCTVSPTSHFCNLCDEK